MDLSIQSSVLVWRSQFHARHCRCLPLLRLFVLAALFVTRSLQRGLLCSRRRS